MCRLRRRSAQVGTLAARRGLSRARIAAYRWLMRWDVLASVVVAVVGWLVGHWLNARRDLANKRRELRAGYLIDAWRRLEKACNRDERDLVRGLESALADVQLLGTPRQAELAATVARTMAQKGSAPLKQLLEELRNDLRVEMDLGSATGSIVHLRVEYEDALKALGIAVVEPMPPVKKTTAKDAD